MTIFIGSKNYSLDFCVSLVHTNFDSFCVSLFFYVNLTIFIGSKINIFCVSLVFYVNLTHFLLWMLKVGLSFCNQIKSNVIHFFFYILQKRRWEKKMKEEGGGKNWKHVVEVISVRGISILRPAITIQSVWIICYEDVVNENFTSWNTCYFFSTLAFSPVLID